jgi:uncharacterized membrane protein
MKSDDKPTKETLDEWHRDPNNWVLGVFYFNQKDKRLLPPKRLSFLGWTVNFANPFSILLLVIIVLAIVIVEHVFKDAF